MPNYIRPRRPGATVFFTVNLADRGSSLLVERIEVLREAVRRTRAERPFRIDAWVVLPDHMHAVWTLPEGDARYSVRMAAIKARFSMAVRRAGFTPPPPEVGTDGGMHGGADGRVRGGADGRVRGGVNPALRKGQVGIWQKRFWEHHIRNDADMAAHVRYCWINPVKHGLVEDPAEWPYSSYHRDRRPAVA